MIPDGGAFSIEKLISPPQPSPPPPAAGRLRRRLVAGLLLLLALVGAFGFALLRLLPPGATAAVVRLFIARQPGARPWPGDIPVTVLVMGLQVGGANTNPLTDAMLVVSVDPRSQTLSLLSIPRDTWVDIPGHGTGRINEAFEVGGPALAVLTAQELTGMPINYWAVVTYSTLEQLVDDAGGVTVTVPRAIDDPTFPAPDEIHYEPLHLKAGTYGMDGHTALCYARERHVDSDFERAARQQQVLMALKARVLQPRNWLRLPLLLGDLRRTVYTNLPLDQGAALAVAALRTAAGQVQRAVLSQDNGAVRPYTTPGGAEVLLPVRPAIDKLVAPLTAAELDAARGGAAVQVDNAAGYPQIATRFSELLRRLGMSVKTPGDAPAAARTRVLVSGRDVAVVRQARLIASLLGVEAQPDPERGPAAIHVILGKDHPSEQKFDSDNWQAALRPFQ